MRSLLFLVLLTGSSPPLTCLAQHEDARLMGKVVDTSKKAISYATIGLYKLTQLDNPLKRTYTNNDGSFTLRADTGNYRLVISHVGYPEIHLSIAIKPGDNLLDTIRLSSASSSLQNIVITVKNT